MHIRNLTGAVWALVLVCMVGPNGWAKTVVWDNSGATAEWNTTVDNWVGSNLFATNDTAQFDNNSPTGNIFLGTGGTAGDVSPAQVYFHFYGRTWTYSGGDILTGNILIDWDSTAVFNQTGSLSFPGGLVDTHPSGIIKYAPAGGSVHFGTANINLDGGAGGGGQFQYNPTAAGTLTNNFIIGASGGSVGGNANATYAGTFTLNGPLRAIGRNIYSSATFLLNGGDRTIRLPPSYQSTGWSQFDGTVSGSANTVTVDSEIGLGTWTDWKVGVVSANAWNVKNVELKGGIIFVTNPATVFGPTRTNGGNVKVWGVLGTDSSTNWDAKAGTFDASGVSYVLMQAPGTPGSNPRTGSRIQALTVNVGSNGSIAGIGEIYCNALNVNSGGTISPGTSAGILTSQGNTTLAAGSALNIELNGTTPGTGYDQFLVNGTVTLGGGNLAVQMGYEPALNDPLDTFVIVNNDGVDAITGTFAQGTSVTLGGYGRYYTGTAQISYAGGTGNDIVLSNLHMVPEPASLALLSLVAAALLRRRARP